MMDEYGESSGGGSWWPFVILAACVLLLALLLVTDTPGRIADAQQAQAVAQAADAYARAEITRAQQAGHTERVQTLALAFAGAAPVLYVIAGLLLGWWLRGQRVQGS
jgi:Flp pilus assembly protein TadG